MQAALHVLHDIDCLRCCDAVESLLAEVFAKGPQGLVYQSNLIELCHPRICLGKYHLHHIQSHAEEWPPLVHFL